MPMVRLFAGLKEVAGTSQTASSAATVRLLKQELAERYGQAFSAIMSYANVAVNGILSDHLDGDDTQILPDDELAILPPVSGGGPGGWT